MRKIRILNESVFLIEEPRQNGDLCKFRMRVEYVDTKEQIDLGFMVSVFSVEEAPQGIDDGDNRDESEQQQGLFKET